MDANTCVVDDGGLAFTFDTCELRPTKLRKGRRWQERFSVVDEAVNFPPETCFGGGVL